MTGCSPGAPTFDVETYRTLGRRAIRFRHSNVRAIVLGSTQPDAVVSDSAAEASGVVVLRRRTGGGAVWVDPDGPIWIDLWVPRADPLFADDIVRAAYWVGDTWAAALRYLGAGSLGAGSLGAGSLGAGSLGAGSLGAGSLGAGSLGAGSLGAGLLEVHRGPTVATAWSQICFAGIGPGEVTVGSRKVVGVAQWRSRQGVLFHSAAYRVWDPVPLIDVLEVGMARRERAIDELSRVAMGLDELFSGDSVRPSLESTLVDCLPRDREWEVLVT